MKKCIFHLSIWWQNISVFVKLQLSIFGHFLSFFPHLSFMIAASHIRWFPSQSYGEEISLKKTFFIYYLETVIYDRELWKTTVEERTLLKVIESESSRARFSRGQLQYLCNTLVLSGNLRKHAGLCKWSSQDASLGLLSTTTTKLLRENMYTVLGKKRERLFIKK